jgi:phage baseplate assembly protein W
MAQANLGTDLALELLDSRALSIYRAKDEERRTAAGGRPLRVRDFVTVEGRENLGQALTARLLTPKGELGPLGHPAYGSRLHEVVGQRNTPTTRNLAKLFIIESLKAERRIETILSVEVAPHPVNTFLIQVAISVKPVGGDAPIEAAFELEL